MKESIAKTTSSLQYPGQVRHSLIKHYTKEYLSKEPDSLLKDDIYNKSDSELLLQFVELASQNRDPHFNLFVLLFEIEHIRQKTPDEYQKAELFIIVGPILKQMQTYNIAEEFTWLEKEKLNIISTLFDSYEDIKSTFSVELAPIYFKHIVGEAYTVIVALNCQNPFLHKKPNFPLEFRLLSFYFPLIVFDYLMN